jgi:hypothetical protein
MLATAMATAAAAQDKARPDSTATIPIVASKNRQTENTKSKTYLVTCKSKSCAEVSKNGIVSNPKRQKSMQQHQKHAAVPRTAEYSNKRQYQRIVQRVKHTEYNSNVSEYCSNGSWNVPICQSCRG